MESPRKAGRHRHGITEVAWSHTDASRHSRCRALYCARGRLFAFSEVGCVIILNFTHPLTPEQVSQIQTLTGQAAERTIEIPTQFDSGQDFVPQVEALADACGLTPAEWQTMPLVIVPPALNFIAVTLLAELHGRMGYFPSCVRMRPVAGAVPPRYEVAEILPLNEVRERARYKR